MDPTDYMSKLNKEFLNKNIKKQMEICDFRNRVNSDISSLGKALNIYYSKLTKLMSEKEKINEKIKDVKYEIYKLKLEISKYCEFTKGRGTD